MVLGSHSHTDSGDGKKTVVSRPSEARIAFRGLSETISVKQDGGFRVFSTAKGNIHWTQNGFGQQSMIRSVSFLKL